MNDNIGGFALLLLLGGIVYLAYYLLAGGKKKIHAENLAALKGSGINFDKVYDGFASIIAISAGTGKIALAEPGKRLHIYDRDMIRGWQPVWFEQGGHKSLFKIQFKLRDENNPTTAIWFATERDMDKWEEILSQAMGV
ncbi:hypothetical protein HL658_19890 [Azospirillum sp. RWY-5-1]|uniref:Uncharacterized protein n=1 Tax=Azospirillum oleiclasticum TaxID=2735135 RepID=A0ABX2TD13_9PROT|nr:hypothetical protein [Azospirillum oleiclasticum]NYZ14814.1 hypothetical protein [Azospirillum oleiclasticum]NYZ22200.1 hypothetical protein [Azospirillum oleiclasticum]